MDYEQQRRWLVKDTIHGEWRELPGLHTAWDVWEKRHRGEFCVAMRATQKPQTESGTSSN
jgi:hypothetical protein